MPRMSQEQGPPDSDIIAQSDQKGVSLPQDAEQTDRGTVGETGDGDAEQTDRGGTGGKGEAPEILTLPIAATVGRKIKIPRMNLLKFCTEYKLEQHVFDLLSKAGFENVRGLVQERDLGSKYGLQLGEVAEVKWALKAMLLTCPKMEEVTIPLGYYKPKPAVRGGFGGAGGAGGKKGGDGGTGRGPAINLEDWRRFGRIDGGIGGDGGASGMRSGSNGGGEKGQKDHSRQEVGNDEGIIGGGTGGKGGLGRMWGGEGGVGGGPIIPLEAVGEFKWIEGGRGGEGGSALEIGGKGGDGEAPTFPRPLTYIDNATRLQIHTQNMNLKLQDRNSEINEKLRDFELDIGDRLLERLHDHGFRTVGALFEIRETELVDPFKPANVSTLAGALEEFLSEVEECSK
ncbi:hypothetical protein MSAN_02442000 [Mycena sanguinolenta]|uniref:Uncharacterized protein n=1 Tax=Mycena sanguinolenta TaxID=230812 RepID=A0A8H6WYP2_9AGAR|nr:hypothetical protein MSAN_02442000 [Mycena sanguinolenta]